MGFWVWASTASFDGWCGVALQRDKNSISPKLWSSLREHVKWPIASYCTRGKPKQCPSFCHACHYLDHSLQSHITVLSKWWGCYWCNISDRQVVLPNQGPVDGKAAVATQAQAVDLSCQWKKVTFSPYPKRRWGVNLWPFVCFFVALEQSARWSLFSCIRAKCMLKSFQFFLMHVR